MKAIAGYWAVQALQNFVSNTALAMAEVGKTAGYLGITAEALQELRYAAEKFGVALDTLEDSLKELQILRVDAKSGSGEVAEAFAALGLKTTDAAWKMLGPLELLSEVADRLNTLPTQADRLWVVDSIFGACCGRFMSGISRCLRLGMGGKSMGLSMCRPMMKFPRLVKKYRVRCL